MPLKPPPARLSGFPARRSTATVRTLYRIFWHRDRSGALNSPWTFSSVPPGAGRFDLPAPDGTCYWSSDRYGAFLETTRGVSVIEANELANRRLATAQAPVLRLAHLLSPKATPFGIMAAISTQPGYDLPQQWAAALRTAGFDGVAGSCSHDPTSKALNVAVFGRAGKPEHVDGWTVTAGPVESDPDLLRELGAYGVRVVPMPHTVPITPPAL